MSIKITPPSRWQRFRWFVEDHDIWCIGLPLMLIFAPWLIGLWMRYISWVIEYCKAL